MRYPAAVITLLWVLPFAFAGVFELTANTPKNLTDLISGSENIIVAKFSQATTTPETVQLLLEPVRAIKGEIPKDAGNVVVSLRTKPGMTGHGTYRVGRTVLLFLASSRDGKTILIPPSGRHPLVAEDLVLPIGEGTASMMPQGWCEASEYRRVACLASAPLLRQETSGLASNFLHLTWGEGQSSDMRLLWRRMRERGGAGAGYALAKELAYWDEDAPCRVRAVFVAANRYEQGAIRSAVDTEAGPVTRKALRCLGDLAMEKGVDRGLRIAAAMAISRMHVPAGADQLVRLMESDDDRLREIGTYGFTLLAAGKPPVRRDVSDLPARVWKLELSEKFSDSDQAMRRDSPDLRIDSPTRGSHWLDWYYRHKGQIDAQVAAVEAAQ